MFAKYILISSLFTIVLECSMSTDVFTSTADMESLALTERGLTFALHKYLETEQNRLTALKQFLSRAQTSIQQVNKTSAGEFVGNPINSYLLLKRFWVDWKNMEELVTKDFSEDVMSTIENARPFFPSFDDYKGAMTAIIRLQDTYHLRADSLAEGVLPGIRRSASLSINDMFELGRHAYELKDWFHTKGWMEACLKKMGNMNIKDGIRRFDVLDHIAFSEYNRGNIRRALAATQEMLKIEPGDTRVLGNMLYYKESLQYMKATGQRGDTGSLDESVKKVVKRSASKQDEWKERKSTMDYERLCRGETRKLTLKEKQKLVCWYQANAPRTKLKPLRVERVWVSPEIFLFRGILSESEIQKIKELATPRLNRATIQDPNTGELKVADYRISKSAWLKYDSHPILTGIKRRTEDASGLTLDTAEELQVANYGIGGHYEPHFDFAREDEDKFTDLGTGNRIATMLFYISNVEAGGATVFTYAEAAIKPSKGDGAFWFNLKKSGEGDYSTRHAACPVLAGTKWVSNIWIHELGQEFRRLCGLTRGEL
ncbi:prolyl 4-hydroxylase subunit alpha-1-like [Rhopilema esculentum]|uniref:prolyl 4-hydroxylase subunit alpha-1-like n=1 Tax=Rhopilema esculentum TaxID=499914 RepID=UPI0031DA208D